MKNIIALGLAVVMGLSALASAAPAQRRTPKGGDGQNINHPLYGGYSYYQVDGTVEKQVCSGRCLLAGILRGTGATTSYLDVRDTAVIGHTASGSLMWRGHFDVDESNVADNPIALPILSGLGITVKLSAASSGERVTVVYIDMD